MKTVHIHIEGQVQGVGFRPHVYRLARQFELTGWVSNGLDGVHIEWSGPFPLLQKAYETLIEYPPTEAIIRHSTFHEIAPQSFDEFSIRESLDSGPPNLWITPDLGMCDDCRNELKNPSDRRYQYPFITCLKCGPRYSIIKDLPYDRPLTSMEAFSMCPTCQKEYDQPEDRRFFSQTNSCPVCAVPLYGYDQKGQLVATEPTLVLEQAVEALNRGNIIAIKGIGGFLLMADATNASSVRLLRERKKRPSKPFALLYSDEEMLEKDVRITEKERAEWKSLQSPIVLFRLKEEPFHSLPLEQIAPHLDRIGIMQPYAPLLELLVDLFGRPLIATSGNVSGYPIFYKNEDALNKLTKIADYILTHDRAIVAPQDDSVVGFSSRNQQRVVFRRSRGLAPAFMKDKGLGQKEKAVFAAGALLKSTFALVHEGQTYVSPYLGDTSHYDVQVAFQNSLKHLSKMLRFQPEAILGDAHPDYFSTRLAQEWAERLDVPLLSVQHHEAHFGAILAEHDLLFSTEPVLGVIWDGTGYGSDGQIWGGEFFLLNNQKIERVDHFSYYPQWFGDKMAREPRLSALALCASLPEADPLLQPLFRTNEWTLYQQLIQQDAPLQTSSTGRLFDGVAALLGLSEIQTFEGEAAMRLQKCAEAASTFFKDWNPYPVENLSLQPLMKAVLSDRNEGVSIGVISLRFHQTLVQMIRQVAKRMGVERLAFSGGVFQNTLLVDLIIEELSSDYKLYFHQHLSPNDENIAFGQLAWAALKGVLK
jgi:hydrogenase maturation protein HypF